MTTRSLHRSAQRQRGVSTLLIAMLLLAIVTIITIFATRVGLFEQRTSGNEYRYKLAFQAAEAGLNQSIEFIKLNTRPMLSTTSGGWLFPGSPRWQPCTDALPAGMAVDPCLAEQDATRRASMYRYVGGTNGVLPLSESLPGSSSQTFTSTGGSSQFATSYNTYATLCRLDISTTPAFCSLSPSTEGTFYVTLVSRGSLANESATATVKQSFGTFRLLGRSPDAPLIAAGVAVGLGNAQIIPNPDAGGFGVPVSVWANGNAAVAGASFATCQLGEWLANEGVPAPTPEDLVNGVCRSCTCNNLCPGYGLLSGNANACGKGMIEGEDILDVDSHFSDASPKLRDSKYFPPDLFAYVFGVPDDTAVSYLTANARQITTCNTAELNAASSGLIWYIGTADCDLSGVVGSLQAPVVLVSNAKINISANGEVYGILFVRSTAGTGAVFNATGTPQIYGSVILQGNADMSGTPTIVYNKAVLRNIQNSPNFLRYGPIPGSWSDTLAN